MMHQIKLKYPEEYLASVSGIYCPVVYGGSPVIRSLTLKTNKRIFGPYGIEEGTPFSFPIDGGHIVGFRGKNGWYLDAIGFRISGVQSAKLIERGFKRASRGSLALPPQNRPSWLVLLLLVLVHLVNSFIIRSIHQFKT